MTMIIWFHENSTHENSTHENSTHENSTHENSTHVKFHPTIDWRVVYT